MWDPPTPNPWEDEPEGASLDELRFLLRRQRDLLTAVATGTSIASKTEEFSFRQEKLRRNYRRLELDNPFPWTDLNSFWAHISAWPTYAERRVHLTDLMDHAVDAIEEVENTVSSVSSIPTWDLPLAERWEALAERSLDLKTEFEAAETIDDLQDVGRRARQIVTEAVKLAWDDSMVSAGEAAPHGDDARAKLDQVLAARVPGPSNERLRKFIRAALELGHETTHSESQEGLEALASAMGAIMAVRLLQELDGNELPTPG